ncbi:RHS repeat domain-containing protein [Pseudoalteromonas sp. T1lg21]|uniref:RHS repeat domain-containing protein n=1 Tax=Pseudoalteromonas sp. T1lg21 TaxID=2077095 RepID=UPI000CF675B5|nr:RHS repeat-associated core domain-containing protein [Pseudoalteromonas sp. T1lg21]
MTVTDANGSVVQHINYDAWGKQNRFYTSSSLVSLLNQQSPVESKGYKGHKEISDLGIIHMNGWIYDPTLGRFLQADPFIQAPGNSQSYNRYSYVLNNPLSYTDPSGYFFKAIFKAIGKNKWLSSFISIALNFIPGCQVWCSAAFNAAVTYAVTGSLKAAAIGFVASAISPGGMNPAAFIARGIIGGLTNKVLGGNFGYGFIAAGAGGAAGGIGNVPLRILASAVIGGTVSKITGGKFANGATSAAFATAVEAGFKGEFSSGKKFDSNSVEDVDEFIKNTKLASKITKSEDGTSMSIVATISGSAEISAADLDSYVSAIESQWTGTYSDDNGKQLSLTVDLQIVESGGDFSVLACAKCGYSLNENRQLRLIRGIALQGGNKMWYSKQYGGKYTAGHEFGHVLGFDHIGTNQLMSSGGGGGLIRNPSYSTIKTLFENY